MEQIWGVSEPDKDRIMDSHIARLRAKLGCCGKHIFTGHGVGYRFQGYNVLIDLCFVSNRGFSTPSGKNFFTQFNFGKASVWIVII